MSVDFSEFRNFAKKVECLSKEYDNFLKRFLLKQALDILGKTKRLTPVDTGYLREMWQISDVKKRGTELIVTIYNPVEYAGFVEYGHLTRDRLGYVRGKFMCTLAIEEVQRRILARFEREFRAWLMQLGVSE